MPRFQCLASYMVLNWLMILSIGNWMFSESFVHVLGLIYIGKIWGLGMTIELDMFQEVKTAELSIAELS